MGKSKNGEAIWFTNRSPESNMSTPNSYKKLGLTGQKSEYFFEIDASKLSELKSLKGDRGSFIFYSEKNISVPKSAIKRSGKTPK